MKYFRSILSAKNAATTLTSSTAGYDTGNRLSTVTDGSFSATYSYESGWQRETSARISAILPQNSL